jgi:RNA-directed DNA polymerase
MGRNESEPHPMSPESFKTGDKPSPCLMGEGRRGEAGQQPAPPQRSGGVGVDSTSGRAAQVNWETSGKGSVPASAPAAEASKADEIAGGVGVPLSSVNLHYFQRCKEPRGDTYSTGGSEAKDAGMAGATRIETPDKVRQLQIALYRKAKTSPKYRFYSLYGELLRWDVLEAALEAQLRNGGIAGVDGESLGSVNANAQNRQQWLEKLQGELKTKSYRPGPVLRVLIPKPGGGERPFGIPTVKDRVVQTALSLLLMPIWEADFHPRSYGFRPKRRAHQALAAIPQSVHYGYVESIEADLSKYFDTIPHRELMKAVARRISDGSVLRRIKSWLRAPIVERDKDGTQRMSPNRCGTPQGGVISPLLANLYLNPLDHAVNRKTNGQARLRRYADDFVITCRVGQAQGILARLQTWLSAKGLKLNEVKTRCVDIRQEGINFLGFNLTWRRGMRGKYYLHREPSQKSRRALRRKLGKILNRQTHWRPAKTVVEEMNRVLRGWAGYFHFGNCTAVMRSMQMYSRNRLRRWLWRKHACRRALWKYYADERLRDSYGLYELPLTAGWKVAR